MSEQLVIFFHVCVLGRGGRSQKSLCSCHLVSWNNKDSITEWLCMQIHPSKHKHTHVPQACRELQYQAEIPLPSCVQLQRLEENKVTDNCQLMGHDLFCFVFVCFITAYLGFAQSQWSLIGSCNPGCSYHGSLEKEMDGATSKKPVLFFTRLRVGTVHRI